MLLNRVFEPYVEARPVCVMARAVLERLLDADRLNAMFDRAAEKSYTQELLFSTLVELMSEVVLGKQPSVHAAYQSQADDIPASVTAVYGKLDRMETGVSEELVRDSFRLAEPVVGKLGASEPSWLKGYQIRVLDGNHLPAPEHRIDELRHTDSIGLVRLIRRSSIFIEGAILKSDSKSVSEWGRGVKCLASLCSGKALTYRPSASEAVEPQYACSAQCCK